MRNLLLVVGLFGAVGMWTGCGGDDHAPALPGGRGGQTGLPGGNKGGSKPSELGGEGGGGGGAGEPAVDPLAPLVSIISPTELDDPNQPGVLVGAEIKVECQVKQSRASGSAKVDAASVKLALLTADGTVVTEKDGTAGNADVFSNTFSLTTADAGRVRFRCTGQDVAKRVGTDTVATFLDKGPAISFVTPTADSFVPLASVLAIEFTVDPAPLAEGDDGAAVDEVSLELGSTSIDLTESPPGTFRAEVNLTDPTLFDPAPNGPLPLVVKASNQRAPVAVTSTVTQPIQVDGAAPVILITSPVNKAVIGGNVVLSFKATDTISGVDPATIVVSLNMIEDHYDPANDAWGFANDTFTYKFDSRQVKNSKVQVTVNVGASDKVGNAAAVATELLYLDNFPPSVDLDPYDIRTVKNDGTCSHTMDPVGPWALNDLEQVQAAGILRSVVWDNTNEIPEIPVVHFSGVAPGSVRVYLRAGSADPLLLDTDNDGLCDDVSDVDSATALQLGPLAKAGGPWITTGDEAASPSMLSLGCANASAPDLSPVADPPKHLCQNEASDLYQVIQHSTATTEPVIYAHGATVGLECTGVSWEFSTFLEGQDGWVCFAARAVDKAGNVGISRPLRVCVDDPTVAGAPACATSSVDVPSCTDGCVPPVRWGDIGVFVP